MRNDDGELYDGVRLPLVALRTPLLPLETLRSIFAAVDVRTALLALLRTNDLVRRAIRIAAPDLADAVDAWCKNGDPGTKTTPLRALAYVARMAARTSPLGICAGVGIVDLADRTTLGVDARGRRTRTRPDMELVSAVLESVERSDKRGKIRYRTNEAVVRRGGRLYVANILLAYQMRQRAEQRPVTLRETAAVAYVREIATALVRYDDLAQQVSSKFGEAIPEVHRLLDALIEAGVLLSEFHVGPMGEPITALIDRLSAIDEAPALGLADALAEANAIDSARLCEQTTPQLDNVIAAFSSLVSGPPKAAIQVDMATPYSGTLSKQVLEDVARLATYGLRMGTRQSLRTLHRRFLERYGNRERMVPILELVDCNLGVGDVGALESVDDTFPEREALVSSIASDAMRLGKAEVELTAEQLEIIAPPLPPGARIPPLEMGFQVAAASCAAIDAGEYVICTADFFASIGTGRSLGRFMHLFDNSVRARARAILDETTGSALRAEFVFTPTLARNYNVSVRPRILSTEIQAGIVDGSNVDRVPLDDLWVGLNNERFFLWSASRGREIEPVETHVFNTRGFAPDLCCLLSLIAQDATLAPRTVPWGPASNMTALPRVRYGRVVLSPRQWNFRAREFGSSASAAQRYIDRVKAEWKLPRFVYLCGFYQRLLLDLESNVAGELLHDQLPHDTSRPVILQEMYPEFDELWLRDDHKQRFVGEFVASLMPKINAAEQSVEARTLPTRRESFGPGSEWLYTKFYLGSQALEELLVGVVAALVAHWRKLGVIDRWFFLRYADPQDHLRFRVRVTPGNEAQVRADLLREGERLLREERVLRYVLDTYEPEYERYGGVDAIGAVENFFTIDSEICLDRLRRSGRSTDERIALAADSFFPWILASDELQTLALEAFAETAKGKLDKADRAALRVLNSRAATTEIRPGLQEALAGSRSSERLRSIFHMHCNRLGIAPVFERRAVRLLRAMIGSRRALESANTYLPNPAIRQADGRRCATREAEGNGSTEH